MKNIIYSIFLVSFLATACKEKKTIEPIDSENPVIVISEPFDEFVYPQSVSIPIIGSITDNIALSEVSIKVSDASENVFFEKLYHESAFTNSRMQHHGEHIQVDVNSIQIDTAIVAINERVLLWLRIEAKDKEGNIAEFERKIDVR